MADANVNTVSITEKQKVKEITDKLEEGLKELFESEKYKNYLSTMSKFHNYSFNNTLLIALQRPDASLVAGYQAWQKNFNRHVKRGEKGIRILAPAPYKIKEERDKLDPVTGEVMLDKDGMPQTEEVEVKIPAFRAVSVFDVSQTDGEPLPELEAKELLSTVEGYEDFIKAVTNVAPAPIGFEDIPGDSKGYFNIEENRIAVQEGMSESQTLKTMVHETAHSMLHNKEVNKEDILAPAKDRNTKEIEAESIAFTVCRHFGIDTSEYSFSYIAGWSSGRDMKELKSSLDTIRRTASELITGIEEQLREIQRDREIMQEQSQEFILAVSNTERSHFDIASVRGMEGAELLDSLLAMKDADRENVEAYLESRGAWVTHLGDDRSEEVEEFHVDYIYDTDTHAITDVKYAMEMDRKANEPIKDSDVVLKIMYGENDGYEIDKITNMTQEQALDLAYKLAALEENEWDGNIQDFMEENGAEYVPIIVKDGRNSGMPEFFDIAVDLKAEEVSLEKELSGIEYAASIVHRIEHGKGVFSPDERNLIVNYGYKLDDYEKTKELADMLAYRIENEPANAALTVIDAQAEIDALPDGMIGLSEMHEYGYTWEEMLPLTKETALELFDSDLAVYQLHKDGSETLIEDKEQITGHEGIFGIEKSDWENERELRSMQAELAESGAEVLAVDLDEDIVNAASVEIPYCKCADITEAEVIKRLGIANIDVVIIAMATNLEASVLAAMLCKEIGVKTVIAKCSSEMHRKILSKVGADRVVFPENESGIRLAKNLLSSGFVDIMDLSNDVSMVELSVKPEWEGKTLIELNLRKKYSINVVAIIEDKSVRIDIDPEKPLLHSMRLIVIADRTKLTRLA